MSSTDELTGLRDRAAVERWLDRDCAMLSTELRRALERGELLVHYLPMVSLAARRVRGVEALVRWDHAGQVLDARRFLALAERTGLIVPIGRWAMSAACRHVALWNRSHPDAHPLRLSVNLSAGELTAPDIVNHVRATLATAGLAPDRLSLEIREDTLTDLGATVGPTLVRLKGLGVRLAVDDFGTGASSLVVLQRYRLDELKIDRSFVAHMDVDADAASIVAGMVRLAASLGIETVAAGVERPAQERMLRDLSCGAAQGWRYARPGHDLEDVVARAAAAVAHGSELGTSPLALDPAPVSHDQEHHGAGDRSLHRAHATLALRATELAEANERLRAFASTVSHDLMQPVAVLAGFLSLLDRGLPELDAEQRAWLDGALRGKERLVQAIEAMHRHATSVEIELVSTDLATLVEDALPGLVADLGEVEVDLDALPLVLADHGLVIQVLANLFQNAGRYRHPARPLMIGVSAHRDGATWVVAVHDTGRGIAPEELESVFCAGARGTAAEGTHGTGRGLATVRSLMARMRGEAWAEPSQGHGARLCLRFVAADS
jgi:EAL domain-containing protein (putative c-di-GMP-specific phosphodiesterase class I)